MSTDSTSLRLNSGTTDSSNPAQPVPTAAPSPPSIIQRTDTAAHIVQPSDSSSTFATSSTGIGASHSLAPIPHSPITDVAKSIILAGLAQPTMDEVLACRGLLTQVLPPDAIHIVSQYLGTAAQPTMDEVLACRGLLSQVLPNPNTTRIVGQYLGVGRSDPISPSSIPRLQMSPHEQIFVNYLNSVLENGIVCRAKAGDKNIKQTSCLDKIPRPANQIEVNFVVTQRGMQCCIYDPRKGALCVALERRNDPLIKTLAPAIRSLSPDLDDEAMTEQFEKRYAALEQLAKQVAEKIGGDPEEIMEILSQGTNRVPRPSLAVLSDRAQCSIMILTHFDKLKLVTNSGADIDAGPYRGDCARLSEVSRDGCIEQPIDGNLPPQAFDVVLISDRFAPFSSYLNVPASCQVIFVPTTESTVMYTYASSDSSRSMDTTPALITHPDFLVSAMKYFNTYGTIITHVSKGSSQFDS